MNSNKLGQSNSPKRNLIRKILNKQCAGFTLAEVTASLFIMLLTCQLLVGNLQLCRIGVQLVQTGQQAPTEVGLLQLEETLQEMTIDWSCSTKTKLLLVDQQGKRFYLSHKLEKPKSASYRDVLLSAEDGAGYMPLLQRVLRISWDYQAPLLTLDLKMMDEKQTTYHRCYLIWPNQRPTKNEANAADTSPEDVSDKHQKIEDQRDMSEVTDGSN